MVESFIGTIGANLKLISTTNKDSPFRVSAVFYHASKLGVNLRHCYKGKYLMKFSVALEFKDLSVVHVDMRMIDGRTLIQDSTQTVSRNIEIISLSKRLQAFEDMLNRQFTDAHALTQYVAANNLNLNDFMPLTIDHIIATHEHARQLREQGKTIWPYKVRFKSILKEDSNNVKPTHLADIANRIAAAFKSQLPSKFFDVISPDADSDFINLIEEMEEASESSFRLEWENKVSAQTVFNGWLSTLYDWCDSNRVFCE
jgi:hypothetical protein